MSKAINILVTGGSGLLGRYVLDAMNAEPGLDTRVFDRKPPQRVGQSFYQGDLLDDAQVRAAVSSADVVVHLAGLDFAVAASEAEFFQTNVQGTWNVLQAAADANCLGVVLCSSVAAVDLCRTNPPRYLPVDSVHPCRPTHAYGLSKVLMEHTGKMFADRGDLRVICLRPALVCWPEIAYSVAQKVARSDGGSAPAPMSHPDWRELNEPLSLTRSFVSPTDAASCFVAAVKRIAGSALPRQEPPDSDSDSDSDSDANAARPGAVQAEAAQAFEVFFVTAEDTISPLATLELVQRSFGTVPDNVNPELFQQHARSSIFDYSKTMSALKWRPKQRWSDLLSNVLSNAVTRSR